MRDYDERESWKKILKTVFGNGEREREREREKEKKMYLPLQY